LQFFMEAKAGNRPMTPKLPPMMPTFNML